ncbi:MAG: helix-turn-helix domain-containing protein [Sedimentisphaerales bacterium]
MENQDSVQKMDSVVQADTSQHEKGNWPSRPEVFGELLSPVEAAQYLRLDQTGNHSPESATRTLNYWRNRGELKATKFARRVWYRKSELDRFLAVKTEQ